MAQKPVYRDMPPPPSRRGGRLTFALMALAVGAVMAASLWIAGTAITEKLKLSRGLRQIVDVVANLRDAAEGDQHLGTVAHEDLLADLQRLRGYPLDGEANGMKTLVNPWRGDLIAYSSDPRTIRVEAVVPPHVCRQLADLFGDDPQAFGLQKLEARQVAQPFWQAVYAHGGDKPGDAAVMAACGQNGPSGIAMTFALR